MAISSSAVARVTGIEAVFSNAGTGRIVALPQRVMLVGQGASAVSYSTDKREVTSAQTVAQIYGYGSPLHMAAQALLPSNGDGLSGVPLTVYPLVDDPSGVASSGVITPAGTVTTPAAYQVRIGGVMSNQFVVADGDGIADICAAMAAAINAVLGMPVIATNNGTDVGLVAKWKGTTGNGLKIQIIGTVDSGVDFTVSAMAGGLVNPSIDGAIAQVGGVWETMAVNCLGPNDSAALDAFSTFGEGRWGALVRKPFVAVCGTTLSTVDDCIVVPSGRRLDRTNVQVPVPGSPSAPWVIAARAVARAAALANENPPHDYGSLPLDGVIPGPDSAQWMYDDRDRAVKNGCSTTEVKNGVVTMGDLVTFYHPEGENLPAYRYVVDIVKLQNTIFNVDLEFAQPKWDGAPLIPDNQPTVNPAAKKPKTAKAAAAGIIENLGLEAILADTASTIPAIVADIDTQNPKRLNMAIPVKISGNTNIISIDLLWGFNFGTPEILA